MRPPLPVEKHHIVLSDNPRQFPDHIVQLELQQGLVSNHNQQLFFLTIDRKSGVRLSKYENHSRETNGFEIIFKYIFQHYISQLRM